MLDWHSGQIYYPLEIRLLLLLLLVVVVVIALFRRFFRLSHCKSVEPCEEKLELGP